MADELIAYFSGLHERLSTRIVFSEAMDGRSAPGPNSVRTHSPNLEKASTTAARYANNATRDHPSDASCPQPIVAPDSRCRVRCRVLIASCSDVRFATRAARMNAALHTCRRRVLRHGFRLSLATADRLSVASKLLLTGRFLDADRAKAVGSSATSFPTKNCSRPASHSPRK